MCGICRKSFGRHDSIEGDLGCFLKNTYNYNVCKYKKKKKQGPKLSFTKLQCAESVIKVLGSAGSIECFLKSISQYYECKIYIFKKK